MYYITRKGMCMYDINTDKIFNFKNLKKKKN